jgi:hypothetical protein
MMTPAAKTKSHDTPKPDVQPQPAPAPTAPAAAVAVQPTKQEQTLAKLRDAWTVRKVDLSKLSVKHDGKYMLINVGEGWPEIKIGPSGGGDIPAVKSFPKFFDAAVIADELLAKQIARTTKPAAPTVAKVVAHVTPAAQPEATKGETPAAKKAKQHEQIESRLQA